MKKSTLLWIVAILSIFCVFLIIIELTWKDFNDINYFARELIRLIPSVLQATLVAIFIKGELKNQEKLTKDHLALETKGIKSVNKNGKLSFAELKDLFLKSELIKIMFVSGKNFFTRNKDLIKESLKAGKEIRILVATPNSDFVKEIGQQLYHLGHKDDTKQSSEIKELLTFINELKIETSGKISIRHFNTEYRVPFFIGYYNNLQKIKVWYNSVIPVAAPQEMLMFYGEADASERDLYYKEGTTIIPQQTTKNVEDEIFCQKQRIPSKQNIIFDLESHFDYVWNKNNLNI